MRFAKDVDVYGGLTDLGVMEKGTYEGVAQIYMGVMQTYVAMARTYLARRQIYMRMYWHRGQTQN